MINEIQNNEKLIQDEISEKIIDITSKLAQEYGAHTVTVRQILKELGATNRVFYNRFHNVDEVLEIIYEKSVIKMRKSFTEDFDKSKDIYQYCLDLAVNVLSCTYDIKTYFNQYMFEHTKLTEDNYKWWKSEIGKIFKYGLEQKIVKDIDPEILSYSIWCFIRGFNSDALTRKMPKEKAIECFKFAFGCFLDGLKIKDDEILEK